MRCAEIFNTQTQRHRGAEGNRQRWAGACCASWSHPTGRGDERGRGYWGAEDVNDVSECVVRDGADEEAEAVSGSAGAEGGVFWRGGGRREKRGAAHGGNGVPPVPGLCGVDSAEGF